MGGDTAFGGDEVVMSVMYKIGNGKECWRYQYRLLATSKTSTMQKEMQEPEMQALNIKDETVFKSMFGGRKKLLLF